MFLSRNKKNNVYPCKPQFYYIKVGFEGVKIVQAYFRDDVDVCLFELRTVQVQNALYLIRLSSFSVCLDFNIYSKKKKKKKKKKTCS